MRRPTSLVLALCLFTAGCTGSGAVETTVPSTTTTASTTTTTVPSTTTTTLPPVVAIEGGGQGLNKYIAAYYAYATGRSDREPPRVPAPLLPEAGSHPELPTVEGKVSVASYRGALIAVFESGKDVLGLLRNDEGWRIVAGRAPSIDVRAWYTNRPILLAVVGSDARPDEVATETRADSIHILGLDGKGGAALVGVPRDAWVSIPGHGTSKINASLWAGGPDMMVETFEQLSGLELDGYVLTGFEGFEHLVDDALLPFEFEVPFTFSDRSAKADFEEGAQEVNGRASLSFVRTRKAFVTGDFQRQLNGGIFLIGALAAAKVRGPRTFPEIIAGTEPWLDTDLSPGQMLRFALAANAVKLTEIQNVVLQGSTATTSGGASIVVLNESAAAEVFDDLADGSLSR